MKNKQIIRINENQLRHIVAEATKRILNEGYFLDKERYDFGYSPQHDKEIKQLKQAGEYDVYSKCLGEEMHDAPGIINDAMRLLGLLVSDNEQSRVSKQIQSAITILRKNLPMIVNAVLNTMTECDRNNRGVLYPDLDRLISKREPGEYSTSYDNDREPEDWFERNEHGDFDEF